MSLKEFSAEEMGIIFTIYIFTPWNVFEYITITPTFFSSDMDFWLDVLSRGKKKTQVNMIEKCKLIMKFHRLVHKQ